MIQINIFREIWRVFRSFFAQERRNQRFFRQLSKILYFPANSLRLGARHPCISVPCGRRALSATERRKTFAQRLASHKAWRRALVGGEPSRRRNGEKPSPRGWPPTRCPLKQRQSGRLRSFGADQERLWRAAACRRCGELGHPSTANSGNKLPHSISGRAGAGKAERRVTVSREAVSVRPPEARSTAESAAGRSAPSGHRLPCAGTGRRPAPPT